MELLSQYPVTRDGYKWEGALGEGSKSKVFKVQVLTGPNTGKSMAIKSINLEDLSDNKIKAIRVNLFSPFSVE